MANQNLCSQKTLKTAENPYTIKLDKGYTHKLPLHKQVAQTTHQLTGKDSKTYDSATIPTLFGMDK